MTIENKEMGISFEVDNQQDFDKWYAIRKEQIRSAAIDEFVEFANTMPTVEEEDGEIRPMWLKEMAQKLKEQK